MRVAIYGDSVSAITCAAALADTGNQVMLVPFTALDEKALLARVAEEPGLLALVRGGLTMGTLVLAQPQSPVPQAEVQIFAMQAEQQGWAEALATALGGAGGDAITLVVRATFPIGTAEKLHAVIARQRPCELVVEPDFLSEGRAVSDFTRPDRILVGTTSSEAEACMRELYRPFNRNRDVMLVVTPRAAELTKFATNAMLAARISLMNEMAQLAERYGVDVEQVRQGLGMDRRIGFDFLYPGVGFGGPHFARDVQRLGETMKQQGVAPELLEAVLSINEQQKEVLFRKAWQHYGQDLNDKTFTVWGLSYKPQTTSVVNAPSLPLVRALVAQGARVQVHDPAAMETFREALTQTERDQVVFCSDPYAAVQESDGLMLVTEWKMFWQPDWDLVRESMHTPVVFDGRNIYTPDRLRKMGFVYYGIGR